MGISDCMPPTCMETHVWRQAVMIIRERRRSPFNVGPIIKIDLAHCHTKKKSDNYPVKYAKLI